MQNFLLPCAEPRVRPAQALFLRRPSSLCSPRPTLTTAPSDENLPALPSCHPCDPHGHACSPPHRACGSLATINTVKPHLRQYPILNAPSVAARSHPPIALGG